MSRSAHSQRTGAEDCGAESWSSQDTLRDRGADVAASLRMRLRSPSAKAS